jgi:uncharacterized membrane protein (UPF0127 family)
MKMSRRRLLQGLALLYPAALMPSSLLADRADPLEEVPLVLHSDRGPQRLTVEMAKSQAQRSKGLMDREQLAADAGMLFLYEEPQSARNGFWMYRTRIPLDIAFIGEEGRILAMHSMLPCQSEDPVGCPVTRPGVSYRAALEVNAGYFEAKGVAVGDCVSWPGGAAHCRAD